MSADWPLDVCVLGHVTRDLIRDAAGRRTDQAGGGAFYGAVVLARLGLHVGLVTKLAPEDTGLLAELRALGVEIAVKESAATTVFESVANDDPGHREYRALSVADPFGLADLEGVRARAILTDPLTSHGGFPALMEKAARAASLVALDIQGFVRKFLIPGVAKATANAALEGLAHVAILKADLAEAAAVTGLSAPEAAASALARLGPREVIITMGSEGSLVLTDAGVSRIPAFAPDVLKSVTGAGDSYLAGYLAARLEDSPPHEAARFGAAVASLKIAGPGAFAGSRQDVAARLARQGA